MSVLQADLWANITTVRDVYFLCLQYHFCHPTEHVLILPECLRICRCAFNSLKNYKMWRYVVFFSYAGICPFEGRFLSVQACLSIVVVNVATVCDKHAAFHANMIDSWSPPTNNSCINYSTHPRPTHIIQGELLMSSYQSGHTPLLWGLSTTQRNYFNRFQIQGTWSQNYTK